MTLFRALRIFLLLLLLAAVAFYSKAQKLTSRSWSEPLEVVIYPINSDASPLVEEYIKQLDDSVFSSIDEFLQRESQYYAIVTEQPTITSLGTPLQTLPPPTPAPNANVPSIMWWGLRFRIWAYFNTPDTQSNLNRIRVFVHYHEAEEGKTLQHSLGLNKGLLALVHAFADQDQDEQNNIIITHELLHTVGAIDKYNADSEPVFPIGYADPEQDPLFPQYRAEIMAGRIPLSAGYSKMAASLEHCIIGEQTAFEINWLSE